MAAPARSFNPADSEDRIAADLASDRARTNREQKTAPDGVIEHASPAFVPRPGDDFLNDLQVPLPQKQAAPTAQYLEQFNRTPEQTNLPLVADQGQVLGLPAAYSGADYGALPVFNSLAGAGTAFGGPSFGGSLAATSENDSNPEEPAPSQPTSETEQLPPQGGSSPQNFAVQLQNLTQRIRQKELEVERLKNRTNDYKKKKLNPLKRSARIAAFLDAYRKIRNYLAVMVEFWWWTIIGAIIDLLVVIPIIAILYGTGAFKGKIGRTIKGDLRKQEKIVTRMEDAERAIQREIMQLRQQENQLATALTLQQSQLAQTTQAAAFGPPTDPGSGIGLAT